MFCVNYVDSLGNRLFFNIYQISFAGKLERRAQGGSHSKQ
jgi:hypothetical protein